MKYLISYRSYCCVSGLKVYGYALADSPIEWIHSVQPFDGETYILLNAFRVTDADIKKYDVGDFKGM